MFLCKQEADGLVDCQSRRSSHVLVEMLGGGVLCDRTEASHVQSDRPELPSLFSFLRAGSVRNRAYARKFGAYHF